MRCLECGAEFEEMNESQREGLLAERAGYLPTEYVYNLAAQSPFKSLVLRVWPCPQAWPPKA
jgi:hypothetical protein